jgi:hypothetical protein
MYEFFNHNGVEYVRINVGMDVVEREATKADHEAADAANAAEKAAADALEAATKERIDRENAVLAAQASGEPVPKAPAEPSQKELEKEFDAGLAHELDDNGKKRKHKHAE